MDPYIIVLKPTHNTLPCMPITSSDPALVLLLLLPLCSTFTFRSPSLSYADSTINTPTQYIFTLQRQFTPSLTPTPYLAESVPAGATITVKFPSEYTLTGAQVVDYVLVDGVMVYGYGVVVAGGVVTVTGAVPVPQFVESVMLGVSNVVNPSPAIITGPFTATIGNDVTAVDSFAAASLTPALFAAVAVTFSPNTANTTGSMRVTLTTQNILPANSTLTITFNSLNWLYQATSINKLPLDSVSACSRVSGAINANINCVGSATALQVVLSNLTGSGLPAGSSFGFEVGGLFSPPTEEPADAVRVTTWTPSGFKIDQSSCSITGIVAKTLSTFTIAPLSSIKTINTNIGLVLFFTLSDTVTRDDTFEVTFPPGTSITYSNSLSTFTLGTVTYSPTTRVLRLSQTSLSQTRLAGTLCNITFLTYRTPNSTKPTDGILLQVLRNGSPKMQGISTFTTDPKNYTFTASTNSTTINSRSQWQLVFTLTDALAASGYLILTVPPQLSRSGFSVTLSSSTSDINTLPTITFLTSSSLSLSNLNRTTSTTAIPTQTITITLIGLVMPGSVQSIGSWGLSVYYSSEGYVIANGMQTTSISTTSGVLVNASISASVNTTWTVGDLRLGFVTSNGLPANGAILLTLPLADIDITLTQCSMLAPLTLTLSCTINSSILTISLPQPIPASSLISITISSITTPRSTLATGSFGLRTLDASGWVVDVWVGALSLSVGLPRVTAVGLGRGTGRNSGVGDYGLEVTLAQGLLLGETNVVVVTFPSEITVPMNSTLSATIAQLPLPSTPISMPVTVLAVSPLQLQLALPTLTTLSCVLTVSPLANPPSLKPTTTGIKVTVAHIRTVNSTSTIYLYSQGSTGSIINNLSSDFIALAYAYSRGYLIDNTNLTLTLQLRPQTAQLQVLLAPGLTLPPVLTYCQTPSQPLICSLFNSTITVSHPNATFPTTIVVILGPISTPATYSTAYTPSIVSSYDGTGYLISRDVNTVRFSLACALPCRTCTTVSDQCTGCFGVGDAVVAEVYYLKNSTNGTYGSCVSTCPGTYYANTTLNSCLACDPPCVQCSLTALNCTRCSNSTFLFNSTCLPSCPDPTYPAHPLCLPCPAGCLACSSASLCSSCSAPLLLWAGQCVPSCPASTTVPGNGTCLPCLPTCLTCAVWVSNCTSCGGALALVNYSCVNSCGSTSMVIVNNTCVACESPCVTCHPITTTCTSCNPNSTYKYLHNGSCVSTCPQLYYSSPNYNCTSCSILNLNCTNCTSSANNTYYQCLSCNPGYILYNNTRCLMEVLPGYYNNSGVGFQCHSACVVCMGPGVGDCNACVTGLVLSGTTCVDRCGNGTVAVNGICTSCAGQCRQCVVSTTTCTACVSPSLLSNTTCMAECPNGSYANSGQCNPCNPPCLDCLSGSSCRSCVTGFYFYSITTLCLDVCPMGWVGIINICLRCQSPCRYCIDAVDYCISCVTGYYLNAVTGQCVLSCPPGVTVQNAITMRCDPCEAPCAQCRNSTTICVGCVAGRYLLGVQCVEGCPQGYWNDLGTRLCGLCEAPCRACAESATICTSCLGGKYLHMGTCVDVCPSAYGLVINSVCSVCSTSLADCLTCTPAQQCLSCQAPSFLFLGRCMSECPAGYTLANSTCLTIQQNANNVLDSTLTSATIFPMPFTIVGCSLFIACLMSKLQNKNTYLIGAAYCVSGVVETASLVYLVVRYYGQTRLASGEAVQISSLPILTVGIVIIYGVNVVGVAVQTPLLCWDARFQTWLKSGVHRGVFAVVSVLSLLVNYKIKLLLFCKLFSFTSTRAQLQSVQKFRIFNVLSFLGVGHQVFVIYMAVVLIMQMRATIVGNEIFLVFIDTIAVTFLSFLLSLLSSKKDEDFFEEEADNGYKLNKKVAVGDDFHIEKQPLTPKYLRGEENKAKIEQMDSFQKMLVDEHAANPDQFYQDEDFSLSISQNRSEVDKNSHPAPKKIPNPRSRRQKKREPEIEQSSNPIRRDQLGREAGTHGNTGTHGNNLTDRLRIEQIEYTEEVRQNRSAMPASIGMEQNSDQQAKQQTGEALQKGSGRVKVGEKLDVIFGEEAEEQEIEEIPIDMPGSRVTHGNQVHNNFVDAGERVAGVRVFREEKQILRQEPEEEQISRKIAIRMHELQGLKRQNSNKDLKKQKREASQKNAPISDAPNTSPHRAETQAEYSLTEHKPTSMISPAKGQLHQIVNTYDEFEQPNKSNTLEQQAIREESALVRQQIQQQLIEERQHQPIQEDIDMAVSLHQGGVHGGIDQGGIKQGGLRGQQSGVVEDHVASQTGVEQNQSKVDDARDLGQQVPSGEWKRRQLNAMQQNVKSGAVVQQLSKSQHNEAVIEESQALGTLNISQAVSGDGYSQEKQHNKQSTDRIKNIFDAQCDQIDDSGLDESHPDGDQEINHHPLKSSFATERRSVQVTDNSDHPLVGILQAGSTKKAIATLQNTEEEKNNPNKLLRRGEQAQDGKTARRPVEKPPLQRPSSTEKGRLYAAGLRQLEDQTLTKKNSQGPTTQQKNSNNSFEPQQQQQRRLKPQDRKKIHSLYHVPIKNLDQKQSLDAGSDFTQHLFIRPDPNTSSEDASFTNPRYISTTLLDDNSEMPARPTIGMSVRSSYRDTGASQQRGRTRRQMVMNQTARDNTFVKKSTIGNDEYIERDQLVDFYARKSSRSPKRSKSKQRPRSRQSQQRMKQLEKVYLQRLDGPKKK